MRGHPPCHWHLLVPTQRRLCPPRKNPAREPSASRQLNFICANTRACACAWDSCRARTAEDGRSGRARRRVAERHTRGGPGGSPAPSPLLPARRPAAAPAAGWPHPAWERSPQPALCSPPVGRGGPPRSWRRKAPPPHPRHTLALHRGPRPAGWSGGVRAGTECGLVPLFRLGSMASLLDSLGRWQSRKQWRRISARAAAAAWSGGGRAGKVGGLARSPQGSLQAPGTCWPSEEAGRAVGAHLGSSTRVCHGRHGLLAASLASAALVLDKQHGFRAGGARQPSSLLGWFVYSARPILARLSD